MRTKNLLCGVLAFLALVVFIGCEKSITNNTDASIINSESNSEIPALAKKTVLVDRELEIPLDYDLSFDAEYGVDCIGEVTHLTGTLLVKEKVFEDANGGVHRNYQVRQAKVRAVGVDTGREWNSIWVWTENNNFSTEVGSTWTLNYKDRLIGKGNFPSLRVHFLFHYTVLPDGSYASEFYFQRLECQD